MFIHLTPHAAVVPYGICTDDDGNIWVAAKGGLFKIDKHGNGILLSKKHDFPRKMGPFCTVICVQSKILYIFTEDKDRQTQFKILNFDGSEEHSQFIDGRVQSMTAAKNGRIFLTMKPDEGQSEILSAHIDNPLDWEPVISSDQIAFTGLCAIDDGHLVAATSAMPVNMYSKQTLCLIDVEKQSISKHFSSRGRESGEVYFPREIHLYQGDIIVLDKTGRIQRFTIDGELVGIFGKIDDYTGNGFCIRENDVIITCSGIVAGQDGQAECDDWLEKMVLTEQPLVH
uniref:SMP-30/Gluconolactonase/LRE-like region domain-containing protein n=1 Tax=Plectus sambesii TaxID=2011161 RepID=A0A914VRS3_9BILA